MFCNLNFSHNMVKKSFEKGYLHVYTGNGKGKTTASLGLAIRAHGNKKKVAVIFFDKGGHVHGERVVLTKLGIPFFVTGINRMNDKGKFRFGVTTEDLLEGKKGLTLFQKLLKEKYDLIVLDEINTSLHLGIVDKKTFYNLLNEWKHSCELVCTGRNASRKLIQMADLVTEMKLKKHYFYQKVPARKGIEF